MKYFYYIGTTLYFIILGFYISSFFIPVFYVYKIILLCGTVVTPPLFYGLMYFLGPTNKRSKVKNISQIWAPFWAAIAALCLVTFDSITLIFTERSIKFIDYELISIISVLVWPTVVILIVIFFYKHIVLMLDRIKEINFITEDGKVKLSFEQTNNLINDLWDEICKSIEGLNTIDYSHFNLIRTSRAQTIEVLYKKQFKRSKSNNKNEIHESLRKLRKVKLIRPSQGGKLE